jgi:hypothetical protein
VLQDRAPVPDAHVVLGMLPGVAVSNTAVSRLLQRWPPAGGAVADPAAPQPFLLELGAGAQNVIEGPLPAGEVRTVADLTVNQVDANEVQLTYGTSSLTVRAPPGES